MWITEWFKKRRDRKPVTEPRLRLLALSVAIYDRFLLERLAERQGWSLTFSTSPRQAFSLASQDHFEVILCDRNQRGYPWREVMDRLVEISPQSCILLVSPQRDDFLWQDVMQHGGYDVLACPLREDTVLPAIDAAVFSLHRASLTMSASLMK